MNSPVHIGILGAGWVVENRHLPGLQKASGIHLSQIWSRNIKKAEKLAKEYAIGRVVQEPKTLIASPDIDAVIVATPPSQHAEFSISALNTGKHVLCQGRMARNLKEAKVMVEAAEKTNLVAALYPPKPGLKGDRLMKRLLQKENYVGDIREVRVIGMALRSGPPAKAWTDDPEITGVNAMTLGLWSEILHRWAGEVKVLSACCRASVATDDGAASMKKNPNSITVSATMNCGANATFHFSEASAHGPGQKIEIYGPQGALIYDLARDRIFGAKHDEEQLSEIPIPEDEIRTQSTDTEFINAIQTGAPVSPDFNEGLQYMRFCEAVARSCHYGEMIWMEKLQPSMKTWGIPL